MKRRDEGGAGRRRQDGARKARLRIAATAGVLVLASLSGYRLMEDKAADAVREDPAAQADAKAGALESAGAMPDEAASEPASPSPADASPSKSASASPSAKPSPSKSAASTPEKPAQQAPAAPDFPVPVEVGNATQLITVKSAGSYATVTAWAKGEAGWKSVLSTTAGRVGSNGVVPGATRRQNTYTTPGGTYTLTEGFGVEAGGTSMPYTRVNSTHWWVQDPESKFYNQMHTEAGADFPLTESGERGSEHLVNYPTQYAKALVIDFNRWPATPGRGAGIFLHVNGKGATAGCVSVPRTTMDAIMTWIKPGAHPRIAIG